MKFNWRIVTGLNRHRSVLPGLAFILCLSAPHLRAQGYGSISGTVTDSDGAAVPNSTVTATLVETGRQINATSNAQGNYVLNSLQPAHYTIRVTATGFQTYQQNDVLLEANQTLTVDAHLAVGQATQTVEVTSAVPQVDTTSGTMAQVIDRDRVVDLPLNGRNAASLMTLVAGVGDATNAGNGTDQGKGKTFPAAVVITANGTQPSQSNYLLDGGNNLDELTNVNAPFPFPDALQEFSIQTSNYSAEFGQSAGAVVNIITKAGTNKFHGALFEFLRNGYFNARPYFATVADNLHRNQFGGTVGGPVIIPHLSTGKATQFFFGYQRTQLRQNSNANTSVLPTLAEEGRDANGNTLPYADLGNLCTGGFNSATGLCNTASQVVRNPFTNVAYPYNRIPSNAFDPASVKFQKVFPTYSGAEPAGTIGGNVNYFKPTIQNFNEYVARVDHDFGAKDHIVFRYYYNYYTQPSIYDASNLLSYQSYFNTRYQNALISETHQFTPNILNSLVVNYQRMIALRGGPPNSPLITDFGVSNIWQPDTGPFLSATISGYFAASSSAFASWGRNNYTFNDDVHWVKGNHNISFGGHIELSKMDVTNVYTSYGAFGFNTVTNKIGSNTYNYPNAYGNFLMGFMSSFGQGNYELVNDRNHFPGVYVQDSWKANPRLTLNYGLRWEYFAPWTDNANVQTAFNDANYVANQHSSVYTNLPAGMIVSGDQGIPSQGVRSKATQFMPRAGFAYDVFGDGKTSIRGGSGIFYQTRLPGFFNLTQGSFIPNTISITVNNPGMYATTAGTNPGGPFSNPYCTGCSTGAYSNPFPFTKPFPSNQAWPNAFQLAEYDPSGNFQVPVTYAYNLILEQQLANSWVARVAYVGSGSRHQVVNLEINPSVNTGSGLSTNQRRVYNTAPKVAPCVTSSGCNTSYGQIIMAAMIGNNNYNSLQATLEKRMTRQLSLMLNYTWSKTFDDFPQNTRVSNTQDLNAGMSYVYPLYPDNATNIPADARVPDIKALDRGLSDIDHTNVLSISYVYKFPTLSTGSGAVRYLANGWRMSGLIKHRSGDVLTAYMGSDNSLTGLSQDRPNYDPGKSAYSREANNAGKCAAGKSCVNWLNNNAFSTPVNTGPGTGFGNVVKGSFRGPGVSGWDAGVMRTFPVYENTSFEFRAEYFNVLNHTILANPNTTFTNSAFGTITATQGDPRIAQFSLKFLY
jgi:Carboxypeptidase regulatory-like domain